MDGIREMATLQGTLLLLLLLGTVARKMKIISDGGKKTLTDLLITFILPCNIINSFRIEFSVEVLQKCFIVLVIALLIQIMCMGLAGCLFNRTEKSHKAVLQYATVCSNAGFMGNPIAETLYGGMGLLYASVYLIPQRIVMWSAGISYFTHETSWKKSLKRVAVHPCVIAVYIGMFLMLTGLVLPQFLVKGLTQAGGCCTTISMVVIGTILAEIDLRSMIDWEILKYSALRLLIIPGIVLAGCFFCGLDQLTTGVSVILAGMPAGSTTAILASKYEGDEKFATKCVVASTILFFLTVPILFLAVRSLM
ncbi:MAG: AEC family transporter [Enterocloster sp.]